GIDRRRRRAGEGGAPDRAALDLLQQSQAVELARHLEVADHDVDRLAAQLLDGVAAAVRQRDLVPRAAQADPEELAHRLLVVDYEDLSHALHYGTAAAATEARGGAGMQALSGPPRTAAGGWDIVARMARLTPRVLLIDRGGLIALVAL